MKRSLLIVLTCTALGAATAGAAADARIEVQRGIAGVRLGMSQSQVKATVGLPGRVRRGSNEIGSYTTYRYPTFTVTFFGGPHVTQVDTASARERTADGIGVGSTRRDLVASLPGARCATDSGLVHCYLGSWRPGRTITDFAIRSGRVTRVSVGYVID